MSFLSLCLIGERETRQTRGLAGLGEALKQRETFRLDARRVVNLSLALLTGPVEMSRGKGALFMLLLLFSLSPMFWFQCFTSTNEEYREDNLIESKLLFSGSSINGIM